MSDEPTIEVPLPEGTRPDPDTVVTTEIPQVAETVEMPRQTFVVETVPTHLLGDPILKMSDQPLSTATSVFEVIQEQAEAMVPPVPKPKSSRRRQMHTADKVLAGMGVTAVVGITFVYGMVAYGWGSRPVPEEATPKPHRTVRVVTPSSTPTEEPSSHPAPRRTRPVLVVVAPTHYSPRPVRTMVVVPSPSPTPTRTTEAPSPSVTPSPTPERTTTPPSPSETPSASPTASQTPDPASPSVSLEP